MLWDDFEQVDRVQAIRTSTSAHYYKKEMTVFGEETVEIPVDEINLAYVAVTRARKRVGTRRVGFYAPARPYAFCSYSRRAARPRRESA